MNTTRDFAARIHSLRFTVVRRSSSMMPIFMVFGAMPTSSSTRPKSLLAKATSSGPCIFGFTTYIEPCTEFARRPFVPTSWSAARAVIAASIMPSGTSAPSLSWIAGLVIRCPTLRTSIRERPLREIGEPSGAEKSRSGCNSRVTILSPFMNSSLRSPFIRPAQFL